jgi:hypothetical protein
MGNGEASQSVSQPASQASHVNQPRQSARFKEVSQSTKSVSHPNQPTYQPTNQPTDRPVNQPNQSVSHPNQPTNLFSQPSKSAPPPPFIDNNLCLKRVIQPPQQQPRPLRHATPRHATHRDDGVSLGLGPRAEDERDGRRVHVGQRLGRDEAVCVCQAKGSVKSSQVKSSQSCGAVRAVRALRLLDSQSPRPRNAFF